LILYYLLSTIFLAEEMNVRKTVTALVSKTLQKCNGHWRTRVYEWKQQSVGILVARCLASKDLMPVGGIPVFRELSPDCPQPGARGRKLIHKRTAKWPFIERPLHFDLF